MGVNKVIYGGDTIVDLTGDTVSPSALLKGYTAHDASGEAITGTAEGGSGDSEGYGITWAGGLDTLCVRTGLAKNFSDPVSSKVIDGVEANVPSSPFDNIMPWAGMKRIEDERIGSLVSIPKFWYKWDTVARGDLGQENVSLTIYNKKVDGALVSPIHADLGGGKGERDTVYIARYPLGFTDEDDRLSVSGANISFKQSYYGVIDTIANILGTPAYMQHFALIWSLAMLYLVEYAAFSPNQYRLDISSTPANLPEINGITDDMEYHTGTITTSGTIGSQYRYIENLFSYYELISGIFMPAYNHPDYEDLKAGDVFVTNLPYMEWDYDDIPYHISQDLVKKVGNITLAGDAAQTFSNTFINPSIPGYEYARIPIQGVKTKGNLPTRPYGNAIRSVRYNAECAIPSLWANPFNAYNELSMTLYGSVYTNHTKNGSTTSRLMVLP